MLARNITRSNAGVGRLCPHFTITSAVARPPARTCPSAPIFQNFILNAGANAIPIQSRVTRSRSAHEKRMDVIKVPLNITPYTEMGFSPVTAKIKIASTTSASTMASARISTLFPIEAPSRLMIRTKGSFIFLVSLLIPVHQPFSDLS